MGGSSSVFSFLTLFSDILSSELQTFPNPQSNFVVSVSLAFPMILIGSCFGQEGVAAHPPSHLENNRTSSRRRTTRVGFVYLNVLSSLSLGFPQY